MGRKQKTKNDESRAVMTESTNQSMESVILQPGSRKKVLRAVEFDAESLNPSSGNVDLQRESGRPAEQRPTSAKPRNPKKRMPRHTGNVRRSQRVRHAMTPARNPDTMAIVEEITLTDTDEEYGPPPQKEQNMAESTEPTSLGEENAEKNLAYIVQRLDAQEKTIEELKSEVSKTSVSSGSPSGADVRYKSMYIDSQKQIEVLTGENKELSIKLDIALAELRAHENGNHDFWETVGKLKDVILAMPRTNAVATAVNMSSPALHMSPGDVGHGSESPVPTRKKPAARGK